MHLNAIPQAIKDGGVDGLIELSPGDLLRCGWLVDNKTIFGRATGARTGFDHNGTVARKMTLVTQDRLFS